ncbi:LuxR C-terminal-related transcriptional regulator [Mangrovimicrobium sediminis]|nr:response regulator transcription factor [Haliea sp. SAOS-164]
MQAQRVVIADDHAIVRRALADMLAQFPAVDLVGEAEHGIDAIAVVKVQQPDLLLLDIAMPYVGGLEIIDEIQQWSPATRVAVFTGVRSGGVLRELLQRELPGLLLKSIPAEELRAGLERILRGETYVCEEALQLASDADSLAALTARERQVMQQVVAGASNQEIAERFNISAKTVDNHRTNLMRKLDVHSLGGLLQVALREGMLAGDGQEA